VAEEGNIFTRAVAGSSHTIAKMGVESTVGSFGGAAAGLGVLSNTAIGIAAFASLIMSQSSYRHRRAALYQMYKDEIAVKLGKEPGKVTAKDMDLLAKGNPEKGIEANKTLAEGLRKLKKRRNVSVLVTTAALLGTVAVLGALFAPAGAAGAAAVTVTSQIAKAFVGFATYKLIESPMNWGANKMFGMSEPTTHERIAELNRGHKKGKPLSQEQVLGVFISGNKEISKHVEEQYGKKYDELSVQEKRGVAESCEPYLPLKTITENLNKGRVKISELAFSVEGQASGIAPKPVKEQPAPGIMGRARSMLHSIGQRLHRTRQHVEEVPQQAAPAPTPRQRTVVEYDNPAPARSFVEGLQARSQGQSLGNFIR
jgi:hypothetical protein